MINIKKIISLIIAFCVIFTQNIFAMTQKHTTIIEECLYFGDCISISGYIEKGLKGMSVGILIYDENGVPLIAETVQTEAKNEVSDTPFSLELNYDWDFNEDMRVVISGERINRAETTLEPAFSDQRNNIYVSPNGNDENIGTIKSPVNTVNRAMEITEQIKAANDGNQPYDINIVFREGRYYLKSAIEINNQYSGNNGKYITFMSYENEKAEFISAKEHITSMTEGSNGIWSAAVSNVSEIYSLSENKRAGYPARYPNEGYLYAEASGATPTLNQFKINETDITEMSLSIATEASLWPGGDNGTWNWFNNIRKVISFANNTVTLNRNASYTIGTGSRYFLQGAKEFLDQSGEFWYDSDTMLLYYKPYEATPEDVSIPFDNDIIRIVGSAENHKAGNVKIQGIEIYGAARDKAAIYIENAENILISDCIISECDGGGIKAVNCVNNITIDSNEIFNIGGHGINFINNILDNSPRNGYSIITNNHIHNVGKVYGHSSCIDLTDSCDNYIANNELHDSGRFGLRITSKERPGVLIGQKAGDIEITEENVREYTHSQNNIVEYNDIYDCMKNSQDGAAVYLWGADTGNIIRYNHIHHSDFPFSYAFGLYLDDAADGEIVYGNLIDNININGKGSLSAVIMIKGKDNIVKNNIFADNNVADGNNAVVKTNYMLEEENNNIVFENNIIYNSGEKIYYNINYDDSVEPPRFRSVNNNVIFNNSGNNYMAYKTTETGGTKITEIPFDEWKNTYGFDIDSSFESPDITYNAEGFYVLDKASSAYDIGFKDIPYEKIGINKNSERYSAYLADENGVKMESVIKNNAYVLKIYGLKQDMYCYAAVYDNDDRLIKAERYKEEVSYTIPDAKYIKLFMFDSNIRPYITADIIAIQ